MHHPTMIPPAPNYAILVPGRIPRPLVFRPDAVQVDAAPEIGPADPSAPATIVPGSRQAKAA